jgi:hypothetical protein
MAQKKIKDKIGWLNGGNFVESFFIYVRPLIIDVFNTEKYYNNNLLKEWA